MTPHYMLILNILYQDPVLSTLLEIKSDAPSKGFAIKNSRSDS
jgi:hypothetical protein